MAQFKNNDFVHDSHATHSMRVEFCVSGIDAMEGEIEFPGTVVEELREHASIWNPLSLDLTDQTGDQLAATARVMKRAKELMKLIVSARYMVQSVAKSAETRDEFEAIMEDYGAFGTIPKVRLKMIRLAKKMIAANARYVANGSPYALPVERFDEMSAKVIEIEEAITLQDIEKSERHHAAVKKRLERQKGDRLLSALFKWLCAIWGVDDDRLLLFGFVSKSQIWTYRKEKKAGGEGT
jgi:hypothetical protein